MTQALILKFGTDVAGAQKSLATFAVSAASSMATIGLAAINAGKSVKAFGDNVGTIRNVLGTAVDLLVAYKVALLAAGAAGAAISSTIGEVMRQIAKLEEIAAGAKAAGVDTNLFQVWSQDLKKLGIDAKDAEAALTKARAAVTTHFSDQGSADVNKYMTAADRLQNGRGFVTASYQAFRDAGTDNSQQSLQKRQEATMLLVQDLVRASKAFDDLRQKGLAFQIASELWGDAGAKIVDGIDKGTLRMDALINKARDGGGEFDKSLVQKAADLTKELENAHDRLNNALHPAMQNLDAAGLQLKSIWVDIVNLIARAAELANKVLNAGSSLLPDNANAKAIVDAMKSADAARDQGMREVIARKALASQLGALENHTDPDGRVHLTDPNASRMEEARSIPVTAYQNDAAKSDRKFGDVPLPTKRPGPDDFTGTDEKADKAAKDSRDQVENYTNSLKKQVAAEEANASTLGKSNTEKERALTLAKAQEAASERGSALTDEERATVLRLADAYSAAKLKIDTFARAQQDAAARAQFFGETLESAIEKALEPGAKFQDIMTGIVKSLEQAALKSLILGQGPLAGLFGTAPAVGAQGSASVGGLFGFLTGGVGSLFSGFHADGGTIGAGQWGIVGEKGPEIVNGPATITPTVALNRAYAGAPGGSQRGDVAYTHAPTYQITGTTPEQTLAMIAAYDKHSKRSIMQTIGNAQARRLL